MTDPKRYIVYILECSNGALYTGYTTDIDRRYEEHCNGSPKCKYTRSFPPKRLLAYWELDDSLSEALKIEAAIKRLSKAEKLRLAEQNSVDFAELVSP